MPVFSTLAPAIEACKSKQERIFIFEEPWEGKPFRKIFVIHFEGKRKFQVRRIDEFFGYYINLRKRHYYEHIMIDTPCRMYFDLEFLKEFNPDFDGDEFMDTFIELVTKMLKEYFDEHISKRNFLVLDSTTEEKFSKHVIVHTQKLFPNNVEIKAFIDLLCKSLKDEKLGIVAKDKAGESCLIVDDGVYNKNRNFRMYLSSKFGKKAILDVDKRFYKFFGKSGFQDYVILFLESDISQKEIFLDSLVIPIDYESYEIHSMEKLPITVKGKFFSEIHFRKFRETLQKSSNWRNEILKLAISTPR